MKKQSPPLCSKYENTPRGPNDTPSQPTISNTAHSPSESLKSCFVKRLEKERNLSKRANLKVKKNVLVWLSKVFREAVSQDRVHVGSAEIRTLIFLQIRISGLGYMQYFPEGVNPHTVSTNPCSNPLSRNPQLGGDARRQCPSHILSNLQLTFLIFIIII